MCAEFCKRNMHRNILKELREVGDLHQSSTLLCLFIPLCIDASFNMVLFKVIQGS